MTPLAILSPAGRPLRPIAYAVGGNVYALPRSLYVNRRVRNADEIITWAKGQGFETTLPASDMHVTVCFSREPMDWHKAGDHFDFLQVPPGRREVTTFDDQAVVLTFESKELHARWQQFRDAGASWDHPEYHPHITISYAKPAGLVLADVVPFAGVIELGPEIFEPVVTGWKDKVKEHAQTNPDLSERLDALEAQAQSALRDAIEESRDALLTRIRNAHGLEKLVKGLELPRRPLILMEVRGMLDRAWEAGQRDARADVREGKRTYASSFVPKLAIKWLRSSAFYITNLIGSKITEAAVGIILNGLKQGKPTSVMMGELLDAFLPYLGDPNVIRDDEQLQPYRLETIVRTNTTAAYNHGRLTQFMDPDILPFLKGVRYSAILDERTTPVCQHLHGKVFKPSSADLEALLPPNHFNCRSTIFPIVAGEKVREDEFITPSEVGRARGLADAKFLSEKLEPSSYATV